MTEPRSIRDLAAADRHLARRVRLWYIRMITRRGGAFLAVRNPSPGHPRDINVDAVRVGCQVASSIVRGMSRTQWREHARRCRAMGMTMPKSVREAEVAANALRKGVTR